eukprot:9318202-Alexandrium_andersonii.AAC.1
MQVQMQGSVQHERNATHQHSVRVGGGPGDAVVQVRANLCAAARGDHCAATVAGSASHARVCADASDRWQL